MVGVRQEKPSNDATSLPPPSVGLAARLHSAPAQQRYFSSVFMRGLRRSFASWRGVGRASINSAPRQRHHSGRTRLRREVGLLRRNHQSLRSLRCGPDRGGRRKRQCSAYWSPGATTNCQGIPREVWGERRNALSTSSPNSWSSDDNFLHDPGSSNCSGRDVHDCASGRAPASEKTPQTIARPGASLLSPVLAQIWNTPDLVPMRPDNAVSLTLHERLRQIAVLGKTGMGKSTLLRSHRRRKTSPAATACS